MISILKNPDPKGKQSLSGTWTCLPGEKKSLVGGNSMWQLTYFRMFTPQIGQDSYFDGCICSKGVETQPPIKSLFLLPNIFPFVSTPPRFLWPTKATTVPDATFVDFRCFKRCKPWRSNWSLEDDWKGPGVFTCFCDVICTCWGIYKFRNYRHCNIFIYTI